jgi:hemolysin III
MLWVANGGALYVMGTMVDFFEWPKFYPGVFAHHELFHLFTLAGSFCHFAFMIVFVVPHRSGSASELAEALGSSDRLLTPTGDA